MERDQASKFIHDLLKLLLTRKGSDLFITADFPPAIKVDGKVTKVSSQNLTAAHTLALVRAVMNDKMDLTSAEGLIDLIHADTQAQAKWALRQILEEGAGSGHPWVSSSIRFAKRAMNLLRNK